MMRQLRALLWKEWRQTRALAVALAIGGIVWIVGVRAWGALDPGREEWSAAAAAGFILIAAALVPAVALAGERSTRTLGFLLGMPVGRGTVVLAKLLASAALWLALAGLAGLLGRACATSPGSVDAWWWAIGASVGLGASVFSGCFLASAMANRATMAALIGAPLGLAVGLLSAFGHDPAVWAVLNVILLGVAVLAVARDEVAAPSLGRRLAAVRQVLAMAAVGLVVAALLTLLGLWAANGLLDPRYTTQTLDLALSPDGRRVAFTAVLTQRPLVENAWRACVLDRETGQATLLTRGRMSTISPPGIGWSPGGRYLAYWVGPPLSLLTAWDLLRGKELQGTLGLYDAQTGESWMLPGREIGVAACIGGLWAGEGELFVPGPEGTVLRYTVGTRRFESIPLPTDFEGPSFLVRIGRAPVVLNWGSADRQGLVMLDTKSGQWLVRPLRKQDLACDGTADGQHLLFFRGKGEMEAKGGDLELLDMRQGTTTRLGEIESRVGLLVTHAFSPGGHWLLYYARSDPKEPKAGFWLLDVPSGRRSALRPPGPLSEWLPRFTPDDAALVWLRADAGYSAARLSAERIDAYVQELGAGTLRPLAIPEAIRLTVGGTWLAGPGKGELIFTPGGPGIYRIGLDGTGLEMLFPEHKAIPPEKEPTQ